MGSTHFWKAAASGALAVLSVSSAGVCQTQAGPAAFPQDPAPIFSAPPAKSPTVEEQFFFNAANKERAAQGLPAYKWDETLAAAARKHAALMVKKAELSHQLPGELPLDERAAKAGARFSSVGENVAIGTDTPGIQDGWMESPGHRHNILQPKFTALGVGVIESDKEFYAVEDFSAAVEDLSREQQEEKVVAVLRAQRFRVSGDSTEARKFCAQSYVPDHRASLSIFRVETPDLDSISEDVERRLRHTGFQQAEVGACAETHSEKGLAAFRIVILLHPDSQRAAVR